MPLASQAMSVPAAGGWVPTEREVHPCYPGSSEKAKATQNISRQTPEFSAGSILLPDVMRRRREEALARQERADAPAAGSLAAEEGLSWLTEGAEETPETERVFRELRKAVTDTIRRNRAQAGSPRETPERAAAPEPPEGYAAPALRQEETKNGPDRRAQAPAGMKNAPPEREHPEMPPADRIAALRKVLSLDPRPQYMDPGEREYGFGFAGYEIRFRVRDGRLEVLSAEKRKGKNL